MLEHFEHPYSLLFLTLGGSRAYGIASDASDYDVRGVHRLSLPHLLGLGGGGDTVEIRPEERTEVATHDLRKFILLLLKGNGNVLETLYAPTVFLDHPLRSELGALAQGCISKRCAAHYRGMAYNQPLALQKNEVKRLLHCYRCLLTGIHLMRTHKLVLDVPTLAKEYGYGEVFSLIEAKRAGETAVSVSGHQFALEQLNDILDEETELSKLPDFTSKQTRDDLEHLLLRVRMEDRDL